MDRGLDPHRQRIVDNATGMYSNDSQEQDYGFSSRETHSTDWIFGSGPLQPPQDHASFNDFGQLHFIYYKLLTDKCSISGGIPFDAPYHTHAATLAGSNRVSLAPLSIYNHPNQQPRTLSNADNHFRSAQNLREGRPINVAPLRPSQIQQPEPMPPRRTPLFPQQQTIPQPRDSIYQLANAMLMQNSMPSLQTQPTPPNFFHHRQPSRTNQLQPKKQQITPPLNLSGFVYSPSAQISSVGSSPPAVHGSSPTERVSHRRATNRLAASSTYTPVQNHFENVSYPEAPRRDNYVAAKRTPQSLVLGQALPMAHGIQLLSPHELPDRLRQVFPYELFNAVQSKCFAPIYRTNDNVVVSAPTGSGKTALLELAICRVVEGHGSGTFKIVYQAPTKSLCAERLRDWQKKFSHLNLQCAELTGDTTHAEMARVKAASIIITTPEKWDSITRKWADHCKLVHLVKLFLIDEVHILKDIRGATLEAVVSRMKAMGADVRFVALSATVPNSHDIALWLGRDHTNKQLPAHRETFGEDFRPVKLQKHVYGYEGLMNDFAFDKVLDGKLPSLIQKHTHKKPIMVFCFTRKSVESTAAMLAEWWTRQRVVDRAWSAPLQITRVGNKDLQQLVGCGVAFHHAGLGPQDRHAIETAYLKGDISLICCTSTLAMGVNLPCHLVVLKGTVGFQDGHLVEYSDLEVMQMLGRAGRPQFDDSAVAVIMTRSDKSEKYKKMMTGQDVLESTLHLNLIEHLNSEISLGSIKDLYAAEQWISGTFLNIRMRQNPKFYKIYGISPDGDTEKRLEEVCERDIKLLQESSLVTRAERFSCTEYGEAMSRYMIQFDTMKLLLSIPHRAKTEQIVSSSEFKDLRMKPQERSFLREFNKSPFIKYPIKETVSTTAHKISLMIQIQLGGIDHPTDKDFTAVRRQFMTDKGIIFDRIHRLIRCVIDCKAFDCDSVSTRHALDLARSLVAEYWENSNLQLRQIPQVGPAAVRKLVSNDINSIDKLMLKDTSTIERIMSKNPPYGRKMKDLLMGFPNLNVSLETIGQAPPKPGQNPKVSVKAVLGYKNDKIPVWMGKKPSVTFMAETTDGKLAHFWRGNIMKLEKGYEVRFHVEISSPDVEIMCWVACEEIVGTIRSCVVKHNLPASAFLLPPPRAKALAQPLTTEKTPHDDDEDEFGGGDFEDDDMLAIVKSVEPDEYDYGSDEFEDIDNLEISKPATRRKEQKQEVFVPSVQMANGKWTCSHACADGQVLKNGKLCKHRCCHEGLDKPRKEKKVSHAVSSTSSVSWALESKVGVKHTYSSTAQKSKAKKGISRFKIKLKDEKYSDTADAEILDLAQDPEPTSYAKLGPRDYRKLHNLHTSIQSDKTVRLPKQKPGFSYASGKEPYLTFLHKSEDNADSEYDEFPSPSDMAPAHWHRNPSPDSFESFNIQEVDFAPPSFPASSLASLEAGMIELDDTSMVHDPSVEVDSSFANGVFDFDAFNETPSKPISSSPAKEVRKNEVASTPIEKDSVKREFPATPEPQHAKHRRVTKDGPVSQASQGAVPAWVNDFDSDLINELKGFVDFID
ncbi:P-loop containing nucleoside triphosphate hydrolase protein [Stipitochalara longipes BDJ]|nr:P-loop containing nucleoside triphosphate hydrolase protein [Stipitochalara longipes BDJ]